MPCADIRSIRDTSSGTRYTVITNSTPLAECTDVVLLTPTEFELLSSTSAQTLEPLFEEFFTFDPATFSQLMGWALVTFIIGYSAGVVQKTLRSN